MKDVMCTVCNTPQEHALIREGLEFHVTCDVCGHVVKFPKTRDIGELGTWIAQHNADNPVRQLATEVTEDEGAMDELIAAFK